MVVHKDWSRCVKQMKTFPIEKPLQDANSLIKSSQKNISSTTCKTFTSLDSMQPLQMTHLPSIVLEHVYSFYMVISFYMATWFQSHKHSNWD